LVLLRQLRLPLLLAFLVLLCFLRISDDRGQVATKFGIAGWSSSRGCGGGGRLYGLCGCGVVGWAPRALPSALSRACLARRNAFGGARPLRLVEGWCNRGPACGARACAALSNGLASTPHSPTRLPRRHHRSARKRSRRACLCGARAPSEEMFPAHATAENSSGRWKTERRKVRW
jgi:hypothetical protein